VTKNIVLLGIQSYIFNLSVCGVCCLVTICFVFGCPMTGIRSVK